MTARSPHAGLVELEPSLYRRGDDPLCAARVRDGLVNGLLHKADSAAQVYINWQPPNEALSHGTREVRRWATGRMGEMGGVPAGTFYLIEPSPFGSIDLPHFGSGEHYELRILTAWGASDGTFGDPPPSSTITVRVYLFPWRELAPTGPLRPGPLQTEHERLVDHVWEATYDATTAGYDGQWLTGATRGPGAFATKLVLSEGWPRTEIEVPNAPAGAARGTRTVLRVGVAVSASVSLDPDSESKEPAVIPLMRALHVQGFVGAS